MATTATYWARRGEAFFAHQMRNGSFFSPEQIYDGLVDARTELWLLG